MKRIEIYQLLIKLRSIQNQHLQAGDARAVSSLARRIEDLQSCLRYKFAEDIPPLSTGSTIKAKPSRN